MSQPQRAPLPQNSIFLATSPNHSLWVNASAGTGKTNILTKRVLGLLLHGVRPEKIICLTYTKAGAAEMAQRIRQKLAEWITLDNAALYRHIAEFIAPSSIDDEMLTRARHLFAQTLDVADGLKIQTIHGFCQSVLQRFPIEAGLLPQFQILDDRQSKILQRESIHHVLHQSQTDPAINSALILLADILGQEDQLEKLLFKFIEKRHWIAQCQQQYGSTDAMLLRLAEKLDLSGFLSEQSLMDACCNDAVIDITGLRRACSILQEGSEAEQRRATAILGWINNHSIRQKQWADYYSIFITQKSTINKKLFTKASLESDPAIESILHTEGERVLAAQNRIQSQKLLAYTQPALTLAQAVLHRYQTAKNANNVLDYDDLIQHTSALLSKPGIAPWILFKLDGGIDHLLIDEAQDTSSAQWEIIRILCAEFFAGSGRRQTTSTIFAVGDSKQSIFSFQGANPAGFVLMQDYFSKMAFDSRQVLETIELQHSFRSSPEILQVVDSVFTSTSARQGVSFFNQAQEQKIRLLDTPLSLHVAMRQDAPGLVELWPLAQNSSRSDLKPWHIPEFHDYQTSGEEKLAQAIAGTISSWLKNGEMLSDHAYTKRDARPISPGDIMILVRRRNRLVDLITRALKQADIPVAGIDRLVLKNHIAVQDLLALGKFALLPDDDLNLAAVLKSPLLNLPQDSREQWLFHLCHNRGKDSVWQRLQSSAHPHMQSAADYLRKLLPLARKIRPFEFFHFVLNGLNGKKLLQQRLGSECLDPIDEFLNLCMIPDLAPNLQEFIHWVETDDSQIKRDLDISGRDQVRIMTVHASKGLQAPIVFLPDTTQLPSPPRTVAEPLWDEHHYLLAWPGRKEWVKSYSQVLADRQDEKDIEEYRRLLYVALTRAEDRLYICGFGEAEDNSWYHSASQALQQFESTERLQTIAADFADIGVKDWQGEILRLGTAYTEKSAARPQPIATPSAPSIMPDWIGIEIEPEPQPYRPLAPSRPSHDDPPLPSPLQKPSAKQKFGILRGKLIHKLLQTLPGLPQHEWKDISARLIKAHSGIDAKESAQIINETLDLLNHPQFSAFFAEGSRAEVPISGLIGKRVIHAQIDRLVITPTHIRILDYKTNRPAPVDIAQIPEGYLQQMAAYRDLLHHMYPTQQIEAALLFTHTPHLILLPDDLLRKYSITMA